MARGAAINEYAANSALRLHVGDPVRTFVSEFPFLLAPNRAVEREAEIATPPC